MKVDEKYIPLIEAVLEKIEKELARCFWNRNQKELNSPFGNTGMSYSNDTFAVRAYDWHYDGWPKKPAPNFEYPGIKVWWYKWEGRGTEAYTDEPLTLEFLTKMLNDCLSAVSRHFGEPE